MPMKVGVRATKTSGLVRARGLFRDGLFGRCLDWPVRPHTDGDSGCSRLSARCAAALAILLGGDDQSLPGETTQIHRPG